MAEKRSKKNWSTWHHQLHKEFLKDKNLIPEGSNLLISVSGGQDSMALLSLCEDIRSYHNWTIHVWHGDHKWHKESGNFASKVQNFCIDKKIPIHIDVATIDISNEEKARDWRYKKLCEKAEELFKEKGSKLKTYILTGHTSTDNAETFLLNLARGSNYTGLSGIQKKRILLKKYFLVRPILFFSREDTYEICKSLNIPICEDPSNYDLTIKRNLIRLNLLSELEKLYPGCNKRINIFIGKMNHFKLEQRDLCELALKACSSKDGIDRNKFLNLGVQARSTILNAFIKEDFPKQLSSKIIEDFTVKIGNKNTGKLDLAMGLKIVWNKKYISIAN